MNHMNTLIPLIAAPPQFFKFHQKATPSQKQCVDATDTCEIRFKGLFPFIGRISVEPARLEDAEEIARINEEGNVDALPSVPASVRSSATQILPRIKQQIQNALDDPENYFCAVARQNGIMIGFAIAEEQESYIYGAALYVERDFRGRRAASELLKARCRWSIQKGQGRKPILIKVAPDNPTVTFHRRNGYQIIPGSTERYKQGITLISMTGYPDEILERLEALDRQLDDRYLALLNIIRKGITIPAQSTYPTYQGVVICQ